MWGYGLLLDENMKPSVDSYQKLGGDLELIWRQRIQNLRQIARAQPLRSGIHRAIAKSVAVAQSNAGTPLDRRI